MTAIPKAVAFFETSLASGLSASGSSLSLVSGTDKAGNSLSGSYYLIINEGSADEEAMVVSISGLTGTITSRGLDPAAPITEVTALKKAHRRGASVKVTDFGLVLLTRIISGDSNYTLPALLRYAAGLVPSHNDDIPNKAYVDGVAVAGAPDAGDTTKGIVEQATQAEIETGAASGGTTAPLFITPSRNGARLYYGYAADGGASDAYAITLAPVPTAYTTGMVIIVKFNTINTGAATINVNSLGVKDIRRNNGLVLANGDIQAGQFLVLGYNGTYFEILSPIGKAQVSQSGEEIYAADAGASDTYAVTLSPVPTAYVDGMVVRFKANTVNTGAATLNVNSLGAIAILNSDGSVLSDGDIRANQTVEVIYRGGSFYLLSPSNSNTPRILKRDPQALTTSGTTELTIATYTVPGGMLGTSRAIRIKCVGNWSQNANSASYTFKLKYGATTLITQAITSADSANSTFGFMMEAVLFANGATNAQFGTLGAQAGISVAGSNDLSGGIGVSGTATEDSTADKVIEVTITSASASHSATARGIIIELL